MSRGKGKHKRKSRRWGNEKYIVKRDAQGVIWAECKKYNRSRKKSNRMA